MTAVLPARVETDDPEIAPVTFILAGNRLVTVRYHEPRPFETFPRRAARVDTGCAGGETVLLALLEAVVDRMADILERAGGEVDRTSQSIFRPTGRRRGRDFQPVLEEIGRKGSLIAHIRDSLATQERLVAFLAQVIGQRKGERDVRPRVKTLARDVRSLSDHATFLSQSITFLLDATLGMVNIDQNATIKIFSLVAVVFLPPTLIASIYGMNFEHMPELGWPFGYPMALGVMVVSAILPYLFFKYRGWL
jgi:magnesium transporter